MKIVSHDTGWLTQILFNLRSNRSGAVAVVTIKWVCPSPQSSAVHCSHCCLRRPPPPESHAWLLSELCARLAAVVNKPVHLIIALYFPLSPPEGPPPPHTHTPLHSDSRQIRGTVCWQSQLVIASGFLFTELHPHKATRRSRGLVRRSLL